jgi:hypothetical protein
VLLLCVVAAWGWVLFARPDASFFDVEGVDTVGAAPPPEAHSTWADWKAVFGPFYGDPDARPAPPPKARPAAEPDGRLPPRAYKVACF